MSIPPIRNPKMNRSNTEPFRLGGIQNTPEAFAMAARKLSGDEALMFSLWTVGCIYIYYIILYYIILYYIILYYIILYYIIYM